MVGATLAFSVMVALVKLARAELGAADLIFWRSLVSVPLAAFWASRTTLRIQHKPLVALRTGLGFGAMFGYFTAAKGLSLMDLSLLGRLQPLVIAMLAPLALGHGERVPPRIWSLMALGLGGCVLLMVPYFEDGQRQWVYGAWALLGLFSSAGAHTSLRALRTSDDPRAIVLWYQLGVLVLSLGLMLTTGGLALPSPALWPVLVGIGLLATVGQLLMTRAYALDKAATVAAASYLGPLFSVGLDALLFTVMLTSYSVIGGVLVVLAGMLLVFGAPRSRLSDGGERE